MSDWTAAVRQVVRRDDREARSPWKACDRAVEISAKRRREEKFRQKKRAYIEGKTIEVKADEGIRIDAELEIEKLDAAGRAELRRQATEMAPAIGSKALREEGIRDHEVWIMMARLTGGGDV